MPIFSPFQRRRNTQEIYHLQCKKCAFNQDYMLSKMHDCIISNRNNEMTAPSILHVEQLPEKCPQCGTEVSLKKISLKIYH